MSFVHQCGGHLSCVQPLQNGCRTEFSFDHLRGITFDPEDEKIENETVIPQSKKRGRKPKMITPDAKKIKMAVTGMNLNTCFLCTFDHKYDHSLYLPKSNNPDLNACFHCQFNHLNYHQGKSQQIPTDPTTPPNPIPLPNPPVPNQKTIQVKLPSAYLGDVTIDAIDRGNNNYELICSTSNNLTLKVIDASKVGFNMNNMPGLLEVSKMQPAIVNMDELKRQSEIVKRLKPQVNHTMLEHTQYKNALVALSFVDAHWNAKDYMDFLNRFASILNVNPSNINFVASFVNIPNVDNAFFSGYMVFCNGKTMFLPMASTEIGSHEFSHGFVSVTSKLVYEAESGALNEHIADSFGLFHNHDQFKRFNENADKSDDIDFVFDYLLGNVNGDQMKYMRNFKDPNIAPSPQPSTYKGLYWADTSRTEIDFGGVHSNSGVGNKLVYELIQDLGFDVAGKLCVTVWKLLGPRSTYKDYSNLYKQVAPQFNCQVQVQRCLNVVGL